MWLSRFAAGVTRPKVHGGAGRVEVAELAVFCNAKRSHDDHHNAKTSFVMMVMLMTKMRMMRDRNLGQPRRRKKTKKQK